METALFYLAFLLSGITWSTEGALKFAKKPNNYVYAEKGTDVTLTWDYSANNKSAELRNIIWRAGIYTLMYENSTGYWKISGAIPSSYAGRVSKEGRASLVIKKITFKDSNSYSCTLKGNPGVALDQTSDVNLVVTGVEPNVPVPKVGDSATFTCNATGIPSQNFTWMKLESTSKIVSDVRHSLYFFTGSSVLVINNITVDDQGFYVCNASVGANQQRLGSAYLQVVYGMSKSYKFCPKVESRYTSIGRSGFALCCPVSGYPNPVITWERNGAQLQKSENPFYFITKVSEEDFGNYTCTATDDISDITSGFSVRDKIVKLHVEATDGTVEKAANLKWEHHYGADYYLVKINGSDIYPNVLTGKRTFLEVHYHTLVMKNEKEETTVCVEVSAFDLTGVIARTKDPPCKTLIIKKPSDTTY